MRSFGRAFLAPGHSEGGYYKQTIRMNELSGFSFDSICKKLSFRLRRTFDDEYSRGLQAKWFEIGSGPDRATRASASEQFGNMADVVGCGSAASADDFDSEIFDSLEMIGKKFGSLGIYN